MSAEHLIQKAGSELPSDRVAFPRVPPSQAKLNRFARLLQVAKNPLLAIPEEAYREPLAVNDTPAPIVSICVCAPQLVNAVLLERADQFPKDAVQLRFLKPVMGNGILTSEGDEWRWQRRTVAGLFRHADTLEHVPAMVAGAESAVDAWRRSPPGTVHSIDRDMTWAAYRILTATLLPGDHEAVTAAIERGSARFNRGLAWAIASSALHMPDWLPFPGKRAMRKDIAHVRNLIAEMIAVRRSNPVDHDDLFDRLLGASDPQTGQAMSDTQLIDNLMTFLLAGHDTTAKALTWSLYVASLLPQWAERLRDEVSTVAGDGPICAEHVERLVLTQQFVKEVMRLFPPIPALSRVAASDTELGGQAIAAGTLIVIPIYVIHRHTRLWDDPERFDPDRFAADKERSYPRYHYMPFGAGPRLCIGSAFALVETTVVLATLLRRAHFSFAGNHPPDPVARIVLLPKGGMPIRVTLR